MRAAIFVAIAVALAACATPLERGEDRYREGDRLGALEAWRAVADDHRQYDAVRARVTTVEDEFDGLVARYKTRARYFERKGRLAESILNYRLALELQPDDEQTLAHVQSLARILASRKAKIQADYRLAVRGNDLRTAAARIRKLEVLDPLDPQIENERRRFHDTLRGAVDAEVAAGRKAFLVGDYTRARRHFDAALALDSDNESARGYLAYLAAVKSERGTSRRPPSSVAVPGTFASDDDIRAEGFFRNALAADRDGEPFSAIRYDLRAVEANPDHQGAQDHLAELRRRLAGSVDVLIEAGRTSFRNEDLNTALDSWRRAQLIDPGNDRVQAYIRAAERRLANLERHRAGPPVAAGRDAPQ